ncbi:MAG TPA: glycosyltransferase family protein, partial [Flavisolibacter sp.]
SYSDKRIIKLLSCFPEEKWHVFSKRCMHAYNHENISFHPVTNKTFVKSMVSAKGIFCGAGFQTPSEALFLKKKLIVIPMKGQYEQQCNAAALQLLGVPVLKNIKKKQYGKLKAWIETTETIAMDFPNETEWILEEIVEQQFPQPVPMKRSQKSLPSPSGFRNLVLKKIFYQPGS